MVLSNVNTYYETIFKQIINKYMKKKRNSFYYYTDYNY